jgi:cell division transport system permease protein
MQLRYVTTELALGLKRNVSMTIAVILTIWLSLSLVGLGLLIRSQVSDIEHFLGSQLELKIVFCAKNSQTPTCVQGQATKQQETAVQHQLADSRYVASYRYETREAAYRGFLATHTDRAGNPDAIAGELRVSDMSTAYWATLAHPNDNVALVRQVKNLPGVEQVVDLRKELDPVYRTLNVLKWLALGGAALLVLAAVLQVSNTIRLAAMARRREIGIMRLVGASSIYIQLPFVLEVVFSALVGAALACGSVVAVMEVFVPWLREHLQIWPWIDWGAAVFAMGVIVGIALLLAVIPTLLMTRKYLKV